MGKNLLTVKPMGTKRLKNKDIGFEVLKKKKEGISLSKLSQTKTTSSVS